MKYFVSYVVMLGFDIHNIENDIIDKHPLREFKYSGNKKLLFWKELSEEELQFL